ncbi:hypothetical protein [Novosphingobium sp.]|uniref:hypothetical protein n=1 Tax=Novosphingobium sp. TaxID=1874826 RepID=UPI002584A8E0|nr:hypothetical protein [Novosphingobium sp.]
MSLNLVVTTAGRAALVNAANNGTLPVTIAQIGISATFTAPVPTLSALPSEIKRLSAIAGEVIADDTLHVTMRDESSDTYALRSLALYLADGTLFACTGQTDPILNKTASSVALAAFDIVFADINAASITFGSTDFMLPSATTERQGIVELATNAEAQTGTDSARALTPAAARSAILGWLLSVDGAGSVLDADLLDGQSSEFYTNIPARLGYVPLNSSVFTAANILALLLNVDGAGSGLDADLLDGHNSSAFRRVASSSITENGGYLVYSDGLKETWGFLDVPANAFATYLVPVPHSSWINPVAGVGIFAANNAEENTGISSVTLSGVTVYNAENYSLRVYIQTKGV